MVKPVGAICNIDCTYCYYLHKKELLGSDSKFRITDEILEDAHPAVHRRAGSATRWCSRGRAASPRCWGWSSSTKSWSWNRSTRNPASASRTTCKPMARCSMTSGERFSRQHDFLVGLSIDGPKELHDVYRVTKDGKPTFDKVFAASQMLHRHGVPFNTLTVVNRVNAKKPLDVYRFLKNEVRPRQMQFIPCVEPKVFRNVAPQMWDPESLPLFDSSAAHPGNPDSVVTDWSIDPDDWGYFLCKIWDDWYRRDLGKVFVNLFETAVAQWMGKESQLCIYHEFCGKGVALEHDGSLYSCDHYVYPEYKLGNITETSSSRMVFSDQQKEFGFAKFNTLPTRCRECKYLFACNGECPKNRLIRTPEGEPGLNYLCSGLAEVLAPHRR